jgi:hypothetical protein
VTVPTWGVTRRLFLCGSAASLARPSFAQDGIVSSGVVTIAQTPAPPALPQDGIGSSGAEALEEGVAGGISGKLVSGFASGVGSAALGQLLYACGIGSQADILNKLEEINSKLDTILHQLDRIESALTALSDKLDLRSAEQEYVTRLTSIRPLITMNATLRRNYDALRRSSDDARPGALDTIRTLMDGETFLGAPEKWHNALADSFDDQGLIQSWNKVVVRRNMFFDNKAAAQIQTHWDYYDAQQALSRLFYVEYLNDHDQHDQVPDFLRQWRDKRRKQLALLRGTIREVDLFYTFNETKEPRAEATFLRALPEGVIVDPKTDLMWWPKILPPMQQDFAAMNTWANIDPSHNPAQYVKDCGTRLSFYPEFSAADLSQLHGGCGYWVVPTVEELSQLITRCGGQIGERDDFKDALERNGFVFPPGAGEVRLWTRTRRDGEVTRERKQIRFTGLLVALRQGQSRLDPAWPEDGPAMALLCRPLSAGKGMLSTEHDNYFAP